MARVDPAGAVRDGSTASVAKNPRPGIGMTSVVHPLDDCSRDSLPSTGRNARLATTPADAPGNCRLFICIVRAPRAWIVRSGGAPPELREDRLSPARESPWGPIVADAGHGYARRPGKVL
jgi:hypothetical protein